jgi:PilZ domain
MTKCPDRRAIPRFPVSGMTATLRVSGHFGRQEATVLDFNREGATLLLPDVIPSSRPIYISLVMPPMRLDGIVGAIHNFRRVEGGGYRCGVQFRTTSMLQFDRETTERALLQLERSLAQPPDPSNDKPARQA